MQSVYTCIERVSNTMMHLLIILYVHLRHLPLYFEDIWYNKQSVYILGSKCFGYVSSIKKKNNNNKKSRSRNSNGIYSAFNNGLYI